MVGERLALQFCEPLTLPRRRRAGTGCLLSLLQLLLLAEMLLLQLLSLLLVLLLQLLRLGCISLLLRELLVFLVLLLLELLPFLILLLAEFCLLLLVFLVHLCVAGIWRGGTFDGRKILGMHCSGGVRITFLWTARLLVSLRFRAGTIGGWMVWRSSLLGRHHRVSAKFPRFFGGRDWRLALVH